METIVSRRGQTVVPAAIRAKYNIKDADAIIAAIASQHNAILLHQDPEYEPLQDVLEMEFLPYKK